MNILLANLKKPYNTNRKIKSTSLQKPKTAKPQKTLQNLYKILVIFLLKTHSTSIELNSCLSETSSPRRYFSPGETTTDQLSIKCPNSANSLRIHSWIKPFFADVGNDKERILLKIPEGKLKVYVKFVSSEGFLRVDVQGEVNVVERKIEAFGWGLFWLQIMDQDVKLVYLHIGLGDILVDNLVSGTLLTSFSLPSTESAKIIKLSEISSPNLEQGFTGIIQNYGYGCLPLDPTILHAQAWNLLSYSEKNEIIALYYNDRNTQIFGNLLDKETRQPLMMNGESKIVDLKDVERIDKGGVFRNVVTQNKFLRVSSVDLGYNADEQIFGVTLVIDISFKNLKNPQKNFMIVEGEKKIFVLIKKTGKFRFELGATVWQSTKVTIVEDQFYVLKIFIGRSLKLSSGVFTFSIHQIGVVSTEEGGTLFDWDGLPDSTLNPIPQAWTVTIGDPEASGANGEYLINYLAIYKGNIGIRAPLDTTISCRTPTLDSQCQIEVIHSTKSTCLHATPVNPVKWYIDHANKNIYLGEPSTPIPNDINLYSTSEISFTKTVFYRPCEYGEFHNGVSCGACHPNCGGNCLGAGETQCLSCSWPEFKFLSSASPSSCSSCTEENFFHGQCGSCSSEGRCPTCSQNQCSTCGLQETKILGVCCNLETGFLKEENGIKKCENCHPDCGKCDGPGLESCTECPGAVAKDSITGLCPTICGVGFWKNNGYCEKCGENCEECGDLGICLKCLNGFVKGGDGKMCVKVEGIVCDQSCVGCIDTPGNCVECQSGYVMIIDEDLDLVNGSNCLVKEEGCHESCLTCSEPNDDSKCSSCNSGQCLKLTGKCATCPPKQPTVTDQNNFLQTSIFAFYVKQRFLNDITQYKLTFSEEEIFFRRGIDAENLKNHMTVQILDFKTPDDYDYTLTFSPSLSTILINFTFKTSIKRTKIEVDLLNPEKIFSDFGKTLKSKTVEIDFSGYQKLSEKEESTLKSVTSFSKTTSTATLHTAKGLLTISTLLSNSLASLSKLVQIIEFSALMELYNIDFDVTLGKFLRGVSEATEFTLLESPTRNAVKGNRHSVAGIWKGKLSQVGTEPLLLQDLGYPGILLIIIYLIQTYFLLSATTPPRLFTMLRISLFNSLIIDYSSIIFRTLGYYPYIKKSTFGEHFSFTLATFICLSFTFELCFMYKKSNKKKIFKGENLTKLEKSLSEVFYDGMNLEKIKKNWFARNYNFFYLLRFYIICILIFNLQYSQIAQVILSFIIIVTFSFLTIYHQIKHGILDTKFTAVYRIIQEISMTFIITLINLFMGDSFLKILSLKAKNSLVIIFICLLALNIFLEILAVIVKVVSLIYEKNLQRKKEKMRKLRIVNRNESTRVLNDEKRLDNQGIGGLKLPRSSRLINYGKNSNILNNKNLTPVDVRVKVKGKNSKFFENEKNEGNGSSMEIYNFRKNSGKESFNLFDVKKKIEKRDGSNIGLSMKFQSARNINKRSNNFNDDNDDFKGKKIKFTHSDENLKKGKKKEKEEKNFLESRKEILRAKKIKVSDFDKQKNVGLERKVKTVHLNLKNHGLGLKRNSKYFKFGNLKRKSNLEEELRKIEKMKKNMKFPE